MSAASTTLDASTLQALQDRWDVEQVLYRYATGIDSFDEDRLRSTLADDIHAVYGNGDPITSGDALTAWILEATAGCIWQHHRLNVYHVDLDGDLARTVSYLTSHQVFREQPDTAVVLAARYHDEVRRTPAGWKISKRTMEILWGQTDPDDGFLDTIGGRGPKVWARD
jgi:SnoaL-like domain